MKSKVEQKTGDEHNKQNGIQWWTIN